MQILLLLLHRTNNHSILITIRVVYRCSNRGAALKILHQVVVVIKTIGAAQILERGIFQQIFIQNIQVLTAIIIIISISMSRGTRCLTLDQLPYLITKSLKLWSNSFVSKIRLTLSQIVLLKIKTIPLREDNILMNFLKTMGLEFIRILEWIIKWLRWMILQLSREIINLLAVMVVVIVLTKIESQVEYRLWIQLSSCRSLEPRSSRNNKKLKINSLIKIWIKRTLAPIRIQNELYSNRARI